MARALHQSENFAWLNSKDKRRGAELILKETAMDLLDSIYGADSSDRQRGTSFLLDDSDANTTE